MSINKAVFAGCMLLFAWSALFAQVVEKNSASFTFPLTTSVVPGKTTAVQQSFFRMAGRSLSKGIVTLEWGTVQGATKGFISIYAVSGALVRKIPLTKHQGTAQCDLSRAGAGVYLVTITYGTYRQNLKLALYK
jgi:hypothetical protein